MLRPFARGFSLVFFVLKSLLGIARQYSREKFATTISSATLRSNVGTMLQLFETTSQQCCYAVLR